MTYTADVSMFPYFKNTKDEFIDENDMISKVITIKEIENIKDIAYEIGFVTASEEFKEKRKNDEAKWRNTVNQNTRLIERLKECAIFEINQKMREEKMKMEIVSLEEFKEKALDENTASAVCEDMMGRIDNLEQELVKEKNEVKVYSQSAKLWEHRYDTIHSEVEFIPSKLLNESNIHFDNIDTDKIMEDVMEAFFTLVSNYDHPFFDWNNELVKNDIYCVEWYDFVYQTMGMGEAENQNRFRDENVDDEDLEAWNTAVENNDFNDVWENEYVEWKTDEEEVYYYYTDGDVYYT